MNRFSMQMGYRAFGCKVALVWAVLALNAQSASITYTYDPLSRITAVYFGDGTVINYAYDAAGNRTTRTASITAPPVIGAPNAPTAVTATAGNTTATITFTAPASSGDSQITSYSIVSSPGAIAAVSTGSPIVVTGLTNGVTYTFTVRATNAAGTGPASAPSNAVTPTAASGAPPDATVPSVPAGLAATAVGGSRIDLSWTASTDNAGVANYKLFRGGLLIGLLGNVTNHANTGLAPATTYSYAISACDTAGNCSPQSASASATTLGAGQFAFSPPLEPGFNLGGNALNITLDVPLLFGNPDNPVPVVTTNVVSVWKWNAAAGRWAFYSPQLTLAGNASYAASRDYDVLSSVNPGEGYWVNAIAPIALPAQSGTGFMWSPANFGTLPSGFNLISITEPVAPSDFNAQVSASPTPGVVSTDNFVSLWAWDAVQGKWYFYSPLLEASGGLAAVKAYADSHNYLHFQDPPGKTLGLGAGFWVNRP